MPETTFSVLASDDDGHVYRTGTEAEWPPTGSTTAGTVETEPLVRKVRHQIFAFTEIDVALIRFDTSSIPDEATVLSATLRVQVTGVGNVTDRNLVIGYYASANWPIDTGDYSGADNPSSDAGVFALTGFTALAQKDMALTNLASVSTSGYTGLRLGIDGAQPAATGNPDYSVNFASFDHLVSAEPQLIVTWAYRSQGELPVSKPMQVTR